jgi:lysozyme
MSKQYTDTKERIKINEGYKQVESYLEFTASNGQKFKELNGGYGHVIKEGEVLPKTDQGQTDWEKVFEDDFNIALTGARGLLDESTTNPQAFGLVAEMVYQIGATGTSKFTNTLQAIKDKDYAQAAIEMLDSKWAKQTPKRAARMAAEMHDLSEDVMDI